jgi:hypothetical protein
MFKVLPAVTEDTLGRASSRIAGMWLKGEPSPFLVPTGRSFTSQRPDGNRKEFLLFLQHTTLLS